MFKKIVAAGLVLASLCSCKMENPLLVESTAPYGAPMFDKISAFVGDTPQHMAFEKEDYAGATVFAKESLKYLAEINSVDLKYKYE